MAKPKVNDFKKYLATLDEAALRAELQKLFSKLPQVQEFYAQELMSESERKAILDKYKKNIYNQFWTRGGSPRMQVSNAEIRRLISDFEAVSVFPHELVDLIIYRVEVATEFASTFGDMPDADYNAAYNAFEKAVKLMAEHKLADHFRSRCEKLFLTDNIDLWYINWLEDIYNEYLL